MKTDKLIEIMKVIEGYELIDYIPTRILESVIGEVCGRSHMTLSNYKRQLVNCGYLKEMSNQSFKILKGVEDGSKTNIITE